jgi:hypothetical protein
MRITIGLAAMASLCLLAGCNKGAANNSTNAPAPNSVEPAPAPEANAAPAAPAVNRDNEIAECSADLGRHIAPGSDVAGLCSCAVDKVAGGMSQGQAVAECSAQLHITIQPPEGGPGGAPAGNSVE